LFSASYVRYMFVYMSVNIGQYPWNKDVNNEVHCKK